MRILQNINIARGYVDRIEKACKKKTYKEIQEYILSDGYFGCHTLLPIVRRDADAFLTLGQSRMAQSKWAREKGIGGSPAQEDILISQIEEHRTEIFYNMYPYSFNSNFVRRLPQKVKYKIAWWAAPGKIDFSGYDLIVSNFPSIRARQEEEGYRTAELFPAHDEGIERFHSGNRDIDVLFFGGYTRHHKKRSEVLEAVAELHENYKVALYLENSRYTSLAETPLGWFGPLKQVRRPRAIRTTARPPIFGSEVYEQIGRAKIVLNAAIDMANFDRGNMRCWEAMGGGALLLSDTGNYPTGMVNGKTMVTYASAREAITAIKEYVATEEKRGEIATAGFEMIRTRYSKEQQWEKFQSLL